MRVANETSVWRDIVNQTPDWRESYNVKSLTDYIDTIQAYYDDLANLIDLSNVETWPQILIELNGLMEAQMEQFGRMGMIRVQGNGMYLPENRDELKFFDGGRGIAGDYEGFSINTLPIYQDVLYEQEDEPVSAPTLCIELSGYREYAYGDLALEPTGGSVSVPIEGQDICFSRAS